VWRPLFGCNGMVIADDLFASFSGVLNLVSGVFLA
jgi:hypothetical protein